MSMVHSLVNVLCILVATIGLDIVFTPPTPPPANEERVASTTLEGLIGHRYLPPAIKAGFWIAALAEMAVILASCAPSSPISRATLSTLIFSGGNAERIHMSPLLFAGAFGAVFAGWVRYKCYKALGPMFTFQMSIRKNHALITSGPYSVVRHPGYTGVLVSLLGVLLLHGARGSWLRESGALRTKVLWRFTISYIVLCSTTIIGLLQRMFREDEALHQRYGKEWEDWARKVPSRLIPGLL